jgi:hypothetical protein
VTPRRRGDPSGALGQHGGGPALRSVLVVGLRQDVVDDVPVWAQLWWWLPDQSLSAGTSPGLREGNDQLRERVSVYAQAIHEHRTERDRRTDNSTQSSPVRCLPASVA